MSALADRRRGGLLGLLIGDAIGVPFEFFSAEEIQELPSTAIALPFKAPPGFFRSHPTAPAGAWSDDGAQALALLDSLASENGLNMVDLGQRIQAWAQQGEYAVNGRVFDMGIQTSRALGRLSQGLPPEECGATDEFENGNGSLMRVIPLALWHTGSDQELVDLAHQQSTLTHGHPRSLVCCALACLWARELLGGAEDGFDEAERKLRGLYANAPKLLRELDTVLASPQRTQPRGSGYVVDCLWSARQAFLSSPDFPATIRHAVSLGEDTDTTAAVAGALAGIRTGAALLPKAWCAALAHHPKLDGALEVLDRLPGLKPKARKP